MSIVKMAINTVAVGSKTAYLCIDCAGALRMQHPEVRMELLNRLARNRRPCDLCSKH